jgi:hypothetical protein
MDMPKFSRMKSVQWMRIPVCPSGVAAASGTAPAVCCAGAPLCARPAARVSILADLSIAADVRRKFPEKQACVVLERTLTGYNAFFKKGWLRLVS